MVEMADVATDFAATGALQNHAMGISGLSNQVISSFWL